MKAAEPTHQAEVGSPPEEIWEIGQHLGWLPHTVRAAFTGLRHAGREVTPSKDPPPFLKPPFLSHRR